MNVLEFRQQCLGVTRDEFARLVGCSYATVYSWEERGIEPGGAFATILDAFEVAARHKKSRALLLSCARDGVGLADVLRDLFEFYGTDRNQPDKAWGGVCEATDALLAVIDALPKCWTPTCDDVATVERGIGEYRCDRHRRSFDKDLPYADALRALARMP